MGAVPLGGTPADGTLAAVAIIGIRHFPLAAPRKRYIRLARRRKGASSFSCRTRVRSWQNVAKVVLHLRSKLSGLWMQLYRGSASVRAPSARSRQCRGSLIGTLAIGGCALCHDALPANELQCSFAQHVGIALAVTGKFDDLAGDTLFDVVVVAGSNPQSDANKFEGGTHDTPSLGVELLAVKEGGDRHGNVSGDGAVVGI